SGPPAGAAMFPAVSIAWMCPLMDVSDGFIRARSVIHPAPAAKCAMVWVPEGAAERSAIGTVVVRNSPRSLVMPRSATAETNPDAETVNVPSVMHRQIGLKGALKGG